MQPVGGRGDKLFPPTFPGEQKKDPPRHVFEFRHRHNGPQLCVLLDSVQSQANRLEGTLKSLRERADLSFPTICVDFTKTAVADVGVITSLDAPHRFCDAILRDSMLGKDNFRKSPEGAQLFAASQANAQAIYEIDPAALNHGAWNSNGGLGAFGARFTRAVSSEIVGIGVATDGAGKPSGRRTSSRIDPLGIVSGARVHKLAGGEWSFESPEDKPSEVLHGNIKPSTQELGVSVDYALHTFVVSLTLFRTLQFPKVSRQAATYARSALIALELAAALGQDAAGYSLRSRCHLVPVEPGTQPAPDAPGIFEVVNADGSRETCEFDLKAVCKLVAIAAGRAAEGGLRWRDKDLVLTPQPKLIELIQRSRQVALQSNGQAEQEDQ
jgi:CRISPR-associated protein Csb1